MKVSVIIPSYNRIELLKWNLLSMSKQDLPEDFEVIVLNDGTDDGTEQLCDTYKDRLNIKYIFTGQRNVVGQNTWRVPGFAINIGVKHSTGDILLFCCAEMYHINDTINMITEVYSTKGSEKLLAIPRAKDDDGRFLSHLPHMDGEYDITNYVSQPDLENVKFPFFLAMRRSVFEAIGGYDEDFTGTDYDDSDLVERLLAYGCSHIVTDAMVIHLWHPRLSMTADRIPRFEHNKKLYEDRQGVIVRNINREWGVL